MKNSKEKVYVKYDELLPERAFGYLSTTGELIMVKKGVMGYFRREDLDNYTADQLNDVLKVTKAQAEAMVHGSKFGWDVQVSDPRFWEDLARKKGYSVFISTWRSRIKQVNEAFQLYLQQRRGYIVQNWLLSYRSLIYIEKNKRYSVHFWLLYGKHLGRSSSPAIFSRLRKHESFGKLPF